MLSRLATAGRGLCRVSPVVLPLSQAGARVAARRMDRGMRYVIVFAAIALFMLWDAWYNQARFMNEGWYAASHFLRDLRQDLGF